MKYSAVSLFAFLLISCGDQKEIVGTEEYWKKSDAYFERMDASIELLEKITQAATICDLNTYNRLAAEYNKKFADDETDFLAERHNNCTPSKTSDHL